MPTDNGIELLAYRPKPSAKHKPHCGDVMYILRPAGPRGNHWGVAIRGDKVNQIQVAPDIIDRDFDEVQVNR